MTTAPRESPRRSPRWVILALAGLLLWSVLLRIWFGAHGLDAGRFWDERYALANVASVLDTRSLVPANGWYPSLSYLPQVALLATADGLGRATGQGWLSMRRGDGFSPSAYLLCRASQSLVGGLTLWLTFLLGRRLFSPETGLLAAAILAAAPVHLRLSATFKPDVLLSFFTLLALLAALRAVERPTVGRRLAAGAAIGLALAAKLNGIAAAIPLAVGSLAPGHDQRERWDRSLLGLVIAAGAAIATFFALNPHPGILLDYAHRNLDIYGERATLAGSGPLATLRQEATRLLGHGFHGPFLGAAALLGLAALSAVTLRGWEARPALHRGRAMLLAYAFGYSLLYALSAGYAKPNNFLQVLPVTSLAAAWLLLSVAHRAVEHLPWFGHRARVSVAGLAAAALLVPPPALYAYRTALPSTGDLARRLLLDRLAPLPGRTVIIEGGPRLHLQAARKVAAAVAVVPDLSRLSPGRLDLADAEVFPASRLVGARSAFYLRRLAERRATDRRRFTPAPFSVWGPSLVVLLHPWLPLERRELSPTAAEADATFTAELPASPADTSALSLEVLLPPGDGGEGDVEVTVDDVPLTTSSQDLSWGGYAYGRLWTSRRFAPGTAARRIGVRCRPASAGAAAPHLFVVSWSAPADAPEL